jgi:D-proline reductase (dithiol) PrdB
MLTSKLEAAQARIREHWHPGFNWVVNDSTPWSPLTKPLSEATVALVSTCGLYRGDVHVPFAAWHDLGDPSYRVIRDDTPPERLRIAHAHYDHHHVAADHEVAFPVIHFHQLAKDGVVGECYPWLFSFMGYLPEPRQLVTETAPEVARLLRADGVDAAFLTPC